jgi:hypothetical protein
MQELKGLLLGDEKDSVGELPVWDAMSKGTLNEDARLTLEEVCGLPSEARMHEATGCDAQLKM